MNSFEQIIQKGEEEESEATTISGEVPAVDADKKNFRFNKEEREQMREKGMSDEEIQQKEKEVTARQQKNKKEKAA